MLSQLFSQLLSPPLSEPDGAAIAFTLLAAATAGVLAALALAYAALWLKERLFPAPPQVEQFDPKPSWRTRDKRL